MKDPPAACQDICIIFEIKPQLLQFFFYILLRMIYVLILTFVVKIFIRGRGVTLYQIGVHKIGHFVIWGSLFFWEWKCFDLQVYPIFKRPFFV